MFVEFDENNDEHFDRFRILMTDQVLFHDALEGGIPTDCSELFAAQYVLDCVAKYRDYFYIYLWEENGEILAAATIDSDTEDNSATIEQFIVDDRCRNRGIGTKFLDAIFRELKHLEISSVKCSCDARNSAGVYFWNKYMNKSRIIFSKDLVR